jgi:hypothetical protein
LQDVRNELVSLAAARAEYGVVLDPTTWTVQAEATQQLRADLRATRGWSATPFVLWQEPPKRSVAAA